MNTTLEASKIKFVFIEVWGGGGGVGVWGQPLNKKGSIFSNGYQQIIYIIH